MLKVIIEMDTQKILSDKKYDLQSVYQTIDDIFNDYGLIKGENGEYLETGNKDDYSNFWIAIFALERYDWFMENVKTWLWCNSDDEDDPQDFDTEDLAEYFRKTPMRSLTK